MKALIALSVFLPLFASAAEPVLRQDAGLRFSLIGASLLECRENGDGGGVIAFFGAPHEQLLAAVARSVGHSEETKDPTYGPFTSFEEYEQAVGKFKTEFLSYLEKSELGIWKNIPGAIPKTSGDPNDPWSLSFRDQFVNPVLHAFAKKAGLAEYTTIVFTGFEAQSDTCRDDSGKFVKKRIIREGRL